MGSLSFQIWILLVCLFFQISVHGRHDLQKEFLCLFDRSILDEEPATQTLGSLVPSPQQRPTKPSIPSFWEECCKWLGAHFPTQCKMWSKVAELLDTLKANLGTETYEGFLKTIADGGDLQSEFIWIPPAVRDMILGEETVRGKLDITRMLRDMFKNNHLFNKGLRMAAFETPELSAFSKPTFLQSKPELFFNQKAMDFLGKRCVGPDCPTEPTCIAIDESEGIENGEENKLWYFRESNALNLYHEYWHLLHSYDKNKSSCVPERDRPAFNCHAERRGELFYYMHRFVLARYESERLSNDMEPIKPSEFSHGGKVDVGYHTDFSFNRKWELKFASREPQTLFPKNMSGIVESIEDVRSALESNFWKGVLGQYLENGISINIDIIPNVVEASNLHSPKTGRYGIHNLGHDIISKMGNGTTGVMGDTATAMRDPVFYQWHLTVDRMISSHKDELPAYNISTGEFALSWGLVSVSRIFIQSRIQNSFLNRLHTFWRNVTYDIKGSSLFKESRNACVKELDNIDFTTSVVLNCTSEKPLNATIRAFVAPRNDKDGSRLTLLQQRKLVIPINIFNVVLNPGENVITRSSTDSSITAPRHRLDYVPTDKNITTLYSHCACGWPQNLLLPKGKPCPGMEFDLIVIVTDGERYRFVEPQGVEESKGCHRASVLCNLPDSHGRIYPDRDLPMGYPFDRLPYVNGWGEYPTFIEDYVLGIPNFAVNKVSIIHHNVVVDDGKSLAEVDVDQCLGQGGNRTRREESRICPAECQVKGSEWFFRDNRFHHCASHCILPNTTETPPSSSSGCPSECKNTPNGYFIRNYKVHFCQNYCTVSPTESSTSTEQQAVKCPPECRSGQEIWFFKDGQTHYCANYCNLYLLSPTSAPEKSSPIECPAECDGGNRTWFVKDGQYHSCENYCGINQVSTNRKMSTRFFHCPPECFSGKTVWFIKDGRYHYCAYYCHQSTKMLGKGMPAGCRPGGSGWFFQHGSVHYCANIY